MKNTETACYALLASAFVLAAVLLVQWQQTGGLLPEAHGEMVLKSTNLTMLTAATKEGEEAVFVIEDSSQTLLIYLLDLPRRQIETRHVIPLSRIFPSQEVSGGSESRPRLPR